jgi:hypothetical protein
LRKRVEYNWGEGRGKGCMYIKDSFTPILLVYLHRSIRKLKFLTPTVDTYTPTPVLSAKIRIR